MPINPKVSVIIPTYNRGGSIHRAISSVQNQTYKDWELIVSDDASDDNTGEIIEELAKKDSRIKLVVSRTNLGAGHARNLAARNASGIYFAFLDSDDRWFPYKLERQVALMDSLDHSWGASYTGAKVHLINRKKIVESRPEKSGELFKELLRFNAPIWTPTFMLRSDIYKEIGGMDPKLLRHQDLDFYRRVAVRYKIAVLSDPLAELFIYTNKRFGIEHIHAKELMYKRYWKKTRDIHGAWVASKVWGREWLVASGIMFRSRNYKAALNYFVKAISTNPIQRPDDYARFFLNIVRSVGSSPDVNETAASFMVSNERKRTIL